MFADDETRLGQLREVLVGQKRTKTDQQERTQRQHLRQHPHGRHHHRRARHVVHDGNERGIQTGKGLDCQRVRRRLHGK